MKERDTIEDRAMVHAINTLIACAIIAKRPCVIITGDDECQSVKSAHVEDRHDKNILIGLHMALEDGKAFET